ncbi:MAG: hypothetical protein H5T69_04925 [Chloroflexi bacterium]|nr:hypothetical protein [Chloroflexota bacterium]
MVALAIVLALLGVASAVWAALAPAPRHCGLAVGLNIALCGLMALSRSATPLAWLWIALSLPIFLGALALPEGASHRNGVDRAASILALCMGGALVLIAFEARGSLWGASVSGSRLGVYEMALALYTRYRLEWATCALLLLAALVGAGLREGR